MDFPKTYLKLTVFYLIIAMVISFIFSFSLYKIATRELNFGFRRQTRFFQEMPQEKPFGYPRLSPERIERFQQEQFSQIKLNLIRKLILLI